jgi:hypothetical protein
MENQNIYNKKFIIRRKRKEFSQLNLSHDVECISSQPLVSSRVGAISVCHFILSLHRVRLLSCQLNFFIFHFKENLEMRFLRFWNGFVTQMTVHGQDIETYFGILKDENSENWVLA